MTRAKRTPPPDRKLQLIEAALHLAARSDYRKVTRQAIAERVGCSQRLVSHYLGTADAMRRDIMRHAVAGSVVTVVAQGLAAGDRHAKRAPEELRRQVAAAMAGV